MILGKILFLSYHWAVICKPTCANNVKNESSFIFGLFEIKESVFLVSYCYSVPMLALSIDGILHASEWIWQYYHVILLYILPSFTADCNNEVGSCTVINKQSRHLQGLISFWKIKKWMVNVEKCSCINGKRERNF